VQLLSHLGLQAWSVFFWFGRELFLPIFEDSGRLRGLANITYSSPAEAAAALEANGQDFNGRWLSVEKAVPREARARPQPGDSGSKPASTSCFLGNLSFQITEDMLREAFAGPWFPDRCFVYARVHPQAGVLIRVGIAQTAGPLSMFALLRTVRRASLVDLATLISKTLRLPLQQLPCLARMWAGVPSE
jgi:hypothetical protein